MKPSDEIIEHAVSAARRSGCSKSKRGVIIFNHQRTIVTATNGPPHPFRCDSSEACRNACNKVAVHAEENALLMAGSRARGVDLLHVKVDASGELVTSGGPSCWQCSRMIVTAGIRNVWLFHDTMRNQTSWKPYSAIEFHSITMQTNNLPRLMSAGWSAP